MQATLPPPDSLISRPPPAGWSLTRYQSGGFWGDLMNETLSEIKDAIQREDYDSAIRLLRPLADAGQSEAQFLFGYLFFTGADVTKDDSRGWLQRAASQDHPDAIY